MPIQPACPTKPLAKATPCRLAAPWALPLAALTFAALPFATFPSVAAADQTGMIAFVARDAATARDATGFVWYPTETGQTTVAELGNAVWEPIDVVPDAAPLPGQRPLVVLSHGMFGNARNQAWLAQGLVAQGYVVVAIDHPGTSTFSRDPDQRRMLWERPRDISRTITQILNHPTLGPVVDADRIFMAGHSLGGFTAVLLAGGRFDPDKIDGFCAENPDDLVCGIFTGWNVARSDGDRAAMAADLSDARIRAFAVFDLGGTQSFSRESLGAVTRPLLVYGAPVDREGLDLDVESRALVAGLPAARVTYHEPATLAHFDFLGVCTEDAITVLTEEEPDDVFVCIEGREERRAKHQQIVAEVDRFFSLN
jgi:predicted dienelactone hydrolase